MKYRAVTKILYYCCQSFCDIIVSNQNLKQAVSKYSQQSLAAERKHRFLFLDSFFQPVSLCAREQHNFSIDEIDEKKDKYLFFHHTMEGTEENEKYLQIGVTCVTV